MKNVQVNPLQTFDNFKVSKGNDFAYSVVKSMYTWHFILIHGETNSGKTHLLNAIANELQNKISAVCYITAEAIADEIKNNDAETIINKFCKYEVLLIDDLHTIPPDTQMQSILYSILNNRFKEQKCCTVMTSQIVPTKINISKEIKQLFNMGLVTDIYPIEND